jgi:hypothetical protein
VVPRFKDFNLRSFKISLQRQYKWDNNTHVVHYVGLRVITASTFRDLVYCVYGNLLEYVKSKY